MTLNPIFLSAVPEYSKAMNTADAVSFGLQTVLLGMGVIFSVLIILMIVLSFFKLLFYKGSNEEKNATEPPKTPVKTIEPTSVQPQSDDAELVAAITAAIAVVMDKPQTSFRVVSFRRTASK